MKLLGIKKVRSIWKERNGNLHYNQLYKPISLFCINMTQNKLNFEGVA